MLTIHPRWLPLFVFLLLAGIVAPARGQTAAEILESAARTRQAATAGVRNYTIVKEMMGLEAVTYFEREEVDGESTFVAKSALVNGQTVPGAAGTLIPDYYSSFPEFVDLARAEGQETIDGELTDVIVIDDFSGVDLTPPGALQQGGEFEPKKMSMAIDRDEGVIRRVVMQGEMSADGRRTPLTVSMRMSDYRNTEGLLFPWSMTITTEGLSFGQDLSPEQRETMKERLVDLEQQLKNMPAEQQEAMAGMAGAAMQKMREMLDTGTIESTIQVREVRVNQGPPVQ